MSHTPSIADVLHRLDHLSELIERRHRADIRRSARLAAQIDEVAASIGTGGDAEQVARLRALAANLSAIGNEE